MRCKRYWLPKPSSVTFTRQKLAPAGHTDKVEQVDVVQWYVSSMSAMLVAGKPELDPSLGVVVM